jgi:SAM-dependent methyltransferase
MVTDLDTAKHDVRPVKHGEKAHFIRLSLPKSNGMRVQRVQSVGRVARVGRATHNLQPATCNLQLATSNLSVENPHASHLYSLCQPMPRALINLAKALLGLLPAYPSSDYKPIDQITPEIGARRAKDEIEDERASGFLRFFEAFDLPSNKVALDLGCGFGGRTIEFQRVLAGHLIGVEIDPRTVAPAFHLAQSASPGCVSFMVGIGEALPLIAESVDLILCYDVLEHVQDPELSLAECFRVLTSGGLALLVFPPYHHPTGAHLEGYCSRMPYMNVMFPGSVLISAVDEILHERGDGYRPQPLRSGDKLYSLNGLSIRRFKRLLKQSEFETISLRLLPLFSKINRNYQSWRMRYYAWIFRGLTHLPLVRECFTHRVVAILRKPLNR